MRGAARSSHCSPPAVARSSEPGHWNFSRRRSKRAVPGTKDKRGVAGTTWDTDFRFGRVLGLHKRAVLL